MSGTESRAGRDMLAVELSARLVGLRKRAGMTQQEVAEAMGKPRTGRKVVGELERQGLEGACLLTLAEYLRAVRAGFSDLKDVLDAYTSLPFPEPVRKQAEAAPLPRVATSAPPRENGDSPSERADARYSPRFRAGREPGSSVPDRKEELKVLRLRRRAGYWSLRRLFECYLHSGLNGIGLPVYIRYRGVVARYARRFFNALYRTHEAPAGKRAERLTRLRASAQWYALLPAHYDLAEGIARFAYKEMREHDELDWMPPEAEARAIMALKLKHRIVTDSQMSKAEWATAQFRHTCVLTTVYDRPYKAALDIAESAKCDARTRIRYRGAALRAANIARTTVPDTPRRKKSISDWHATAWPEELDRRVLERMLAAALATWDEILPTLPPAPGPRPV